MFLAGTHSKIEHARQYICGLLQAERPNMERMEEAVPGTDYQCIQQFVTDSTWDHREVMDRVAVEADAILGGHEGSCLLIDESGFAKSGSTSAGVARQYNGRLGKVDNCQVGVCASLSAGDRVVPVDMRLFLPQSWTEDTERCKAAGIPKDERVFKTKPKMALEMVRHQRSLGVRFACVGMDGLYGSNPELLRDLDADGEMFMADVHCDQRIYLEDPRPCLPEWEGRGRQPSRLVSDTEPIRVDRHIAGLGESDWREFELREATRGPLAIHFHAEMVWLWDGVEERARRWWLLARRELDGQTMKYSVCNADDDESPLRLARLQGQRYWVERAFEDAKGQAGMADYQMRKYRGWHHHMALVLMTMLFMTEQRMLHKDTVPLLSCADIRAMLARFLPRRDVTRHELLRQMHRRHAQRQASIDGHSRRRQGEMVACKT